MGTTAKTTTAKGNVNSIISKAKNTAAIVDRYADELKAKQQTYRKIPGFSDYEINAQGVVRSNKTGKIQQIPAGKKKYLIFNDKGERRSIGLEDIKNLLPAVQKPKTEKADKAPRKPKQERSEVAVDVEALKKKPAVKTILEAGGKKHVICYKLHLHGLTVDEIMALTDTPYGATKRNIWFYTTGAKKLE